MKEKDEIANSCCGRNCSGCQMERGSMDLYFRAVRGKVSQLSMAGLKLEDDLKLVIIPNGLPEPYRYLVVSLEKEETINFDEKMTALSGTNQGRKQCCGDLQSCKVGLSGA